MTGPRHPAVVDCGSNSTRLWLADPAGGPPLRREVVTRLGKGVDATGHLDDERLAHCLAVVGDYAEAWRARGIDDADVTVIATSAVRDATDRDRFFTGVREVAHVDARVLSGEEEARTSFLGAIGALDVPSPTLVVDIGGGSTELVVGGPDDAPDALRVVSLQLGTVRLTERHLHGDPPGAGEVAAARRDAQATLLDGLRAVGIAAPAGAPAVASVVAVAGTAMTLAALDRGSRDDLHGHRLSSDRLTDLALALLSRPVAQRLELGPLDDGRADVIAAGALVLDTLVDLTAVDVVVASEADNLDGVAGGALDADVLHD